MLFWKGKHQAACTSKAKDTPGNDFLSHRCHPISYFLEGGFGVSRKDCRSHDRCSQFVLLTCFGGSLKGADWIGKGSLYVIRAIPL